MTKIKVLQLIDSLNVGGAEVLAVNLANSLSEKGYESHICTTRKEGDLKKQIDKSVGYLFLKRKKTFDLKAIKRLNNYVKLNDVKYIHAHSSSVFTGFCLKILNQKIKLIWHDHYGDSEFLSERNSTALKFFSHSFSSIISVNKALKLWAEKNLNCEKVAFINNFVEFRDLDQKTKLKGTKDKRIVMLAGFRPQKDHINLLNAFRSVLNDFPEWTLHLVGKRYKDSYSDEINAFINDHELTDKVYFYGVQSDIKNILEQASIGVLSSKSEGLPLSLLEYGLASLPVVITDVGECKTVLDNNKNGILVKPNNSKSLFEGLKSLITDENKRTEVSNNLNKVILENYSKENVIHKYLNIYREC